MTDPCRKRSDLLIVASSSPLEIAHCVRQVGDWVLPFVRHDCFHRFERQDDSVVRNQVLPDGAQFRVSRAQEAVAFTDLWSVQLRDVLHAPCMLYCADNSDDVHGGVRNRDRKTTVAMWAVWFVKRDDSEAEGPSQPQLGHKKLYRASRPSLTLSRAGLSLKKTQDMAASRPYVSFCPEQPSLPSPS